jgi:hypothetical protein
VGVVWVGGRKRRGGRRGGVTVLHEYLDENWPRYFFFNDGRLMALAEGDVIWPRNISS